MLPLANILGSLPLHGLEVAIVVCSGWTLHQIQETKQGILCASPIENQWKVFNPYESSCTQIGQSSMSVMTGSLLSLKILMMSVDSILASSPPFFFLGPLTSYNQIPLQLRLARVPFGTDEKYASQLVYNSTYLQTIVPQIREEKQYLEGVLILGRKQFYQMRERLQSSLQSGRTIGNYVVTRNLGEGTFGKVKLGIHNVTGQKVAVKVLEKSRIVDVSDVERVTREIHILKQIRHPNLIQLYEIIETPKQLFLVMEYVSEGQLFELIVKKKRLKEAEACEFFRQLLAGVEYLHQLGIVHRDLKPENLLIDFNRTLKIVDFGLSNTYKTRQVLKTACGSPCYAAPEMIAGKKYHGLNADIWSCGVVLFAMVCGYLPFEDPNTTALYKKIIAGDYVIPKFVSPAARELISALLTTDPQKRLRLRDIKNHPWFLTASQSPLKIVSGLKVNVNSIPVDPAVLAQLSQFGENTEEARKYIQNNRHNHSITIYYLLLKKQLRSGIQSELDICSPLFNPASLRKEDKKEKSQSTNTNDLEQIQLDPLSNPIIGPSRANRIVSRLSHLRQKDQKRRDQTPDLKLNLDNLPTVDRSKYTAYEKKRVQQIILSKQSKQPAEELSLYDIDQTFTSKFHQTISTGWRKPPSFRSSVNKSTREQKRQQKKQEQRREEKSSSQRYRSVQGDNTLALMNRTFMGKIPKAYIPRWQNESERIRSILNTTITGHGKRKNKPHLYF